METNKGALKTAAFSPSVQYIDPSPMHTLQCSISDASSARSTTRQKDEGDMELLGRAAATQQQQQQQIRDESPSRAKPAAPTPRPSSASADESGVPPARKRALTLPWSPRWVTTTLEFPAHVIQHGIHTMQQVHARRNSSVTAAPPAPVPTTLVRVKRNQHHHGYSLLPILTAISWFGTLLALLLAWKIFGVTPHKKHAEILFISWIGAEPAYKPFFVVGCVLTSVGLLASLIADRSCRSLLGVSPESRSRASVLSFLSIIFGGIAGLFLVMLSLYDLATYARGHWACAGVAFTSAILCLAFNLAENEVLRVDHPLNYSLRTSGLIKVIALAVATMSMLTMFTVQSLSRQLQGVHRMNKINLAATMEWVLALMLAFYVLALCIDLGPYSRAYFKQVMEKDAYVEVVVPKYTPQAAAAANVKTKEVESQA